ncbi:GTPase HflX [Polyangium jinanense]|uniref:GTPase HflX n=1 Tax=Polyangium jinanense TaxID=2829994 RepID=A0A9X3XGD4_9BACT|nr:GTPase HflX [Polyangium jinanense]MDC3962791.1 GTPase HflX [Polyangium jinanense]MDC3989532.1 GTPase HflX [Polyangium jinanense]
MSKTGTDRPAAVLVAVQLATVADVDHAADMAELGRLVNTLGYDVVATVSQRRSNVSKGAVLGEGKLRVLAEITGGPGPAGMRFKKPGQKRDDDDEEFEEAPESAPGDDDADDVDAGVVRAAKTPTLVVVDHDLSPSQLRNLEKCTGAEVLDRSGVIIEIFHRHARSREARLEVEIARLNYVAPRLRESSGGGDRQRGRGAGESQLELDRRKIRDRIAELRREIDGIQREQATRRALRQNARRVALVGYTNAGKSSLMRALTGSDVYVMDKLFATLDTTVRALHPEVKPRILVSDTVGFIKKLPHDLVASFRSTLDEALEASLLLYLADASDPTFRSQLEVTRSTLEEIGAEGVPYKLVLNKIDRIAEEDRTILQREFPEAILMSAKDPADITRLRQILIDFFDALMVPGELVVPYTKQALVSEVYEHAKVLSETYDEAGAHLVLRAEPAALARLQSLVQK